MAAEQSAPAALLAACIGWAALHGAAHLGFRSFLASRCHWYLQLRPEKQAECVVNAVWLLLGLQLPVLYTAASFELWESIGERWHGTSILAEWALTLHIGQSLYETAVYARFGKGAEFFVHHAVVVINYGLSLYYGAMHFWAATVGLVEYSNPCLSVLQLILISGKGRGSRLEMANGAALWVAFLLVRVIGLPLWLYCHVQDVRGGAWTEAHDPTVRASAPPPAVVLWTMRLLAPLGVFMVWMISMLWFRKITAGMLNAIRGDEEPGGSASSENERAAGSARKCR
jgi:hypothetical protein|tara:strand:+ start:1191 stop:2045 length:855 start_codon:yes stop_codon:yes gene_type:complete